MHVAEFIFHYGFIMIDTYISYGFSFPYWYKQIEWWFIHWHWMNEYDWAMHWLKIYKLNKFINTFVFHCIAWNFLIVCNHVWLSLFYILTVFIFFVLIRKRSYKELPQKENAQVGDEVQAESSILPKKKNEKIHFIFSIKFFFNDTFQMIWKISRREWFLINAFVPY